MTIIAGSDILASDFVSTAAGAGDSGKVAKLDSNGKILDAFTYKSYFGLTANGDILANDGVYITSANTVKTIYPTDQTAAASISTAASHSGAAVRMLPLSTAGLFLNFQGGDLTSGNTTSSPLYAQVRVMNSDETDFSNGSEQTIYSTGNGTTSYDVCPLGGDKFLIIFQATSSVPAAAGIKCVVVSVSGTTITVGSIQTIETTGGLSYQVSCCKLNTDKALIGYMKDSDGDFYVQVLSVSGTTITTNTAVKVKTASAADRTTLTQLGTDSALFGYAESSSFIYAVIVTVSGTTPSAGAQQTIVGTNASYGFQMNAISATKALLFYKENNTPTNDQIAFLTISGATITKGSNLSLTGFRVLGAYFGFSLINAKYALVSGYTSSSAASIYFIDLTGSTPSVITSQSLSMPNNSNFFSSTSIVKVSPWTYVFAGYGGVGDYIFKMIPSSSNHLGIAPSAIANAATGQILHRFRTHTLTGLTLTAGSKYYIDDSGQPTNTGASLTAPVLGLAVNTTDILLQ